MKKAAPFIFFGIIIAFFVIKDAIRNNKLSKNHRFSSGAFYRITASVDGGPLGEFKFLFNKKWIKSSIVLRNKKTVEIGKYYLVKFNPNNPNSCKIDIEKEISPEIFQSLPDSGWLNPPPFTKRENIPVW